MQLMLFPCVMTFCYRDNDTPAGKRECDLKMLAELNTLVPKDRREKVDRQLVRSIIGLKHRNGTGYTLERSTGKCTSQASTEMI